MKLESFESNNFFKILLLCTLSFEATNVLIENALRAS